jgi:hypothetical protein
LRNADVDSKRRQLEGRTSDLVLDTVDLDAATAFEEPADMVASSVTKSLADKVVKGAGRVVKGADKSALSRAESRESFANFGMRESDEDDSGDNGDIGDFSAYASEYVSEEEDFSEGEGDGFAANSADNDEDAEDFSRFGAVAKPPAGVNLAASKAAANKAKAAANQPKAAANKAKAAANKPPTAKLPRVSLTVPGGSVSRSGSGKSRVETADPLSLAGYLVNQLGSVVKVLTGDDNGDKVDLNAEFEQVAEAVVKNTTVAGQREVWRVTSTIEYGCW